MFKYYFPKYKNQKELIFKAAQQVINNKSLKTQNKLKTYLKTLLKELIAKKYSIKDLKY